MMLDEAIANMSPDDKQLLLIGAGAQKPECRLDLFGGGLFECAQEGRLIRSLCDPKSFQSLAKLGRLYLANLEIEVGDD